MLTDLRSGVIDGVVVYDLDRLARDNRDLEDAIETAQYSGKVWAGVTGSVDLSTDGGRAMARVLVAMQNKSSAHGSSCHAQAQGECRDRGSGGRP